MDTQQDRILVAGDDGPEAEIAGMLEAADFRVAIAHDSEATLQLLQARGFETALLSLALPGHGGMQVLDRMKSAAALRELPAIVYGSPADVPRLVQCIELGAADYLLTPLEPVLLRSRIGSAVAKQHAHYRELQMAEELQQRHREVAELHEVIKDLSIRDGLTGLYNRRYFDEQANRAFVQARRYGHPLCVMVGDIDGFKSVNDNYSHTIGDEVLRQVGRLLVGNIRDSDIVARYGGEEFVIALVETPPDQAACLCEKLRALIEAHPWSDLHPDLRVTMSMGLDAGLGSASLERLVAAADARLKRAKELGRNRLCSGDA
jgi:diguanylate cyclase (GGDEF)-like protein